MYLVVKVSAEFVSNMWIRSPIIPVGMYADRGAAETAAKAAASPLEFPDGEPGETWTEVIDLDQVVKIQTSSGGV